METFSALLAICAGNSPVTGEFHTQRPVTRCFDVFFDLRLGKRLSKQWWGWWFETPLRPWWRHRNDIIYHDHTKKLKLFIFNKTVPIIKYYAVIAYWHLEVVVVINVISNKVQQLHDGKLKYNRNIVVIIGGHQRSHRLIGLAIA